MKLAYSHAGDNLLDTATVTLQTGSALTGYGLDKLNDGDPARPFKAAETTIEIRFAWAAPVLPAFPVLGNSNLTVAATLEGRSDASWGAAEVGPFAFAIPTLGGDGLYSSPFQNLTGTATKRFWRLKVTGNAAAIIIGELWLGSTYRYIDSGYQIADAELGPVWSSIRHETEGGAELVYTRAARRESVDGHVGVTPSEAASLDAWAQSCRGDARPSVMVPRDDVNDAWMVRLAVGAGGRLKRAPFGSGGYLVELPLRQLSPGPGW